MNARTAQLKKYSKILPAFWSCSCEKKNSRLLLVNMGNHNMALELCKWKVTLISCITVTTLTSWEWVKYFSFVATASWLLSNRNDRGHAMRCKHWINIHFEMIITCLPAIWFCVLRSESLTLISTWAGACNFESVKCVCANARLRCGITVWKRFEHYIQKTSLRLESLGQKWQPSHENENASEEMIVWLVFPLWKRRCCEISLCLKRKNPTRKTTTSTAHAGSRRVWRSSRTTCDVLVLIFWPAGRKRRRWGGVPTAYFQHVKS